jgi:hypothetical protein
MKITRSFSRKLNLGNYETADFYCEAEDDISDEEEDVKVVSVSSGLHKFCKEEVERSINEYEQEIIKKKAEANVSVDSPKGVVNLDLGNKKLNFVDEPK